MELAQALSSVSTLSITMKDWAPELIKLSMEMTWRKLLRLLGALLLIILGFLCFERYTSSFELARLQKASTLLVTLSQLNAGPTNGSKELAQAQAHLEQQALKAIEQRPLSLDFIPTKVTFSPDLLWKFVFGSTLWLLACLTQIRMLQTKELRQRFLGLLFYAGLSGFISLFIPTVNWPWLHLFAAPFLLLALFSLVMLFSAFRSAKAKARSNNCINSLKIYSLAAHNWALDNGDIFPRDMESLELELGTPVPACASGGEYRILSPGAPSSEPSVVFARCTRHGHLLMADGTIESLGDRKLVRQNGVVKLLPKDTTENKAVSPSKC